jgi:TPR repeat protein
MHLVGRGVARDTGEAQRWFLKSAAQGHPTARANLALMQSEFLQARDAEGE